MTSKAFQFNRRQLIQVGSGAFFGLSLPQILHADSQSNNAKAKSCIFIIVSGGLSHIDTLDPKPNAPTEIRGPYKPIATSVPGIQFTEMMPQLAKLAHRYLLVRSFSHRDTVHVTAVHTMLTGQSDGRRSNQSPFMGSLISRFRPADSLMPSYVWLHNMKTGTNKIPRYENGLHLIGHEHAPLKIGYEMDNPSAPDFKVKALTPPASTTPEEMRARFRLLQALEQQQTHNEQKSRFASYQERALSLVTGPAARNAFDLKREPEKVRERYGKHPLGQYLLMSRRLIEAGTRLVTVTAWPGVAPGETKPTVTQVWDNHDIRYSKGDSMYGNGPFGLKWSLPRLDQGVSALIEDMHQRGMLDETLVVVLTEFGRTPKFEGKGRGRGHWPQCYSGILAGGGVKAGAVYGSSDKQGAYVAGGRPVSHVDFGATLFQALGIAPETRYGPDGFSFRINTGKPLHDWFA